MVTLTSTNVRLVGQLLNDDRFMNKDMGKLGDEVVLKIVEDFIESSLDIDDYLDGDRIDTIIDNN
jgi:hypothetical protein